MIGNNSWAKPTGRYSSVCLLVCGVLLFLTSACERHQPLFTAVDPAASGVDFVNQLVADRQLNIIDFNGFYNGGGVAAGDINNDGLPDLYFTSNRGKNRLYLNEGNFKFRDITETARVGGSAEWTTGVTFTDVNGDGLLDIYVTALAGYKHLDGANQLFVNNGDLTFNELGAILNLDARSSGCQTTFFDYDHDGDLDCYLVNMSNDRAQVQRPGSARDKYDPDTGDRLYRNDAGQFKDVSKEAGIYQSPIGFGLSASVGDFNNDGWVDIYVANDFYEHDYYYLNQQDGTFREAGGEYFGHTSRFSMGSDAADLNNDGFLDLFTLDMAPEDEVIEKASLGREAVETERLKQGYGYRPQFGQNALQINQGGRGFTDLAPMLGVEATDWSWSPLLADFDNDGVTDIFVANGIVKRPNDLDLISYLNQYPTRHQGKVDMAKYYQDYYDAMPFGVHHDYLYRGVPGAAYEDKSQEWGLGKETVSNGAAYADLDGDGDLELIVNRINQPALIYRNHAREAGGGNFLRVKLTGEAANVISIGAKVYVRAGGQTLMRQVMLSRGFLSAVGPEVHFGLGAAGRVDSVWAVWPGGKTVLRTDVAVNGLVELKVAEAAEEAGPPVLAAAKSPLVSLPGAPELTHKANPRLDLSSDALAPFSRAAAGPALAVADVNGDGREDFFLGGSVGTAGNLYVQQQDGTFRPQTTGALTPDSLRDDVAACFFDANGDDHPDLYVGGTGRDGLYLNDGTGGFTVRLTLPENGMTSCVQAFDYDGDGDHDLFVGKRGRADQYGVAESSLLLANDGKGSFTVARTFDDGMVTAMVWADVTGDGAQDAVVVGEWEPVRVYENLGDRLAEAPIVVPQSRGLWQSLAVGDFNQDGQPDIAAGNLGLNTRLIKRDGSQTVRLYVGDLDGNGKAEQLLCYERNGKWFPTNNRDELAKALPALIKKRFPSNADFAGKPIDELFTAEELGSLKLLTTDRLSHTLFSGQGGGKFETTALPRPVQTAPACALVTADINNDGYPDLLGGGNLHTVSPYQGRYDAGRGFLLTGQITGLTYGGDLGVSGEIRGIAPVTTPQGQKWLLARHGAAFTWLESAPEVTTKK